MSKSVMPELDNDPSAALLELARAVLEQPGQFGYFQLLRAIEQYCPDLSLIGTGSDPAHEPIRIGQDASMAFKPAAIARWIVGDESRPHELRVNIFGLLGPNGALPHHMTRLLAQGLVSVTDLSAVPNSVRVNETPSSEEFDAALDFVNLIQHRFFSLFYRAWAMSQPAVHEDRPLASRYRHWVAAVGGLGSVPHDVPIDQDSLVHVAALSVRSRGPAVLQGVLEQELDLPVRIESFVGRWIRTEASRLGMSRRRAASRPNPVARLGEQAQVGPYTWDAAGKFRIHLGPLSPSQWHRVQSEAGVVPLLKKWVTRLAGAHLAWDVRVHPDPQTETLARGLSASNKSGLVIGMRLGTSAWLGRRRAADQVPRLRLGLGHESEGRRA